MLSSCKIVKHHFSNALKRLLLKDSENVPVSIFGLVCPENEIKLCWELNNSLKLSLSQTKCITATDKRGSFSIGLYQYQSIIDEMHFALLTNKANPVKPFAGLQHIDYLFVIRGNFDDSKIGEIRKSLNSISTISTVIQVPESSFKKADFLNYLNDDTFS